MSAPAWLTYVGAVTGIIGSITGMTGAVMAYISYRRISHLKALGLRLELRKRQADAHEIVRGLPSLLNDANDSRFAVASAIGMLRTGGMEVWKEQLQTDLVAVRLLQAGFQHPPDDSTRFTHRELEDKLVEVHRLLTTASQYVEKYRMALAADDRERERIRNSMRPSS